MRHIKVRAQVTPGRKTFDLTFLEQSHVRYEFGGNCEHPAVFVHGELALISSIVPQWKASSIAYRLWNLPSTVSYILYVKGSDNPRLLRGIPTKYWPKIKEAIKAYNDFYLDRD